MQSALTLTPYVILLVACARSMLGIIYNQPLQRLAVTFNFFSLLLGSFACLYDASLDCC